MEKLNSTFKSVMASIFSLVILLFGTLAVQAQTYPTNFSQVAVATGISNPTVMAFAPDGRIFVAQQNGSLIVIKNGIKLTTPAIQLSVNSSGERGLIGIALHPDFPTNGFVYLYYTLPDGSRNRVSRFTMSGDVINPSTQLIILNLDPLSSATNHNGGAMHFKGDKLYIAIGENANGSQAQSLETYHGKLLRVNADGSAPADNPFNTTGASEQRRRIWAYGLRNPYTFDVQPGTGKIFVNDVGQSTWEEINDATTGGLNFGWPTTEGATTNPAFTSPVYAYQHGSGDGRGCAITGGVFFNPSTTNYPASFIGKYFFQDLCNAWINYLDLTSGAVRNSFATSLPGQSLAIDVGNDGNLYYLSRNNSTLYRIIYSGSQVPMITDQPDNLTVTQGQPATFQVSASGTAPLTYQWRKNGSNITGAPNAPTFTISSAQPGDAGNYSVVVSNAAGSATSQNAALTVTPFNAPPAPSITAPAAGALYRGGDVINFSGTASDPEDGTLPASAFSWSVVFHHGSHVHDGPPAAQGTTSGSFTIPNSGETAADVFYRLILTVTDSDGLTASTSVDINPRTTTITLASSPSGLSLTLDGQPVTTPYSTLGVEGILRTLGVVTPQTLNGTSYTFNNWSHGGSATQTIATPIDNTTYTANFTAAPGGALPPPWLSRNIGNGGSASFANNTFTVSGTGNDIWGTSDQFFYAYQVMTGNVDIRARVTSITNTHSMAKAGVMIRDDLNRNGRNAMTAVTPGSGITFQSRVWTGGSTTATTVTGAAPYWVRLVRSGNSFTSYYSTNGTAWTQIGSPVTIIMRDNIYVGLPVTSHTTNTLCTATFTNVTVTGMTSPAPWLDEDSDEQREVSGAFTVSPNPLRENTLHMTSLLDSPTAVRVQIVDLTGKIVYEKELGRYDAGEFNHDADMTGIAQGAYIVRLLSANGNSTALLIRQ